MVGVEPRGVINPSPSRPHNNGEYGIMNLGGPEIIPVMIVMFFFFGANKIPGIMKRLGTGLREFKKAARHIQDNIEHEVKQIEVTKSDKGAT
jgi:sec-independent protein translocase protein TatA